MLRDRRKLFEHMLDGADRVFPVRRLPPDGLEVRAQVLERGYEGMVGKDDASPKAASRARG